MLWGLDSNGRFHCPNEDDESCCPVECSSSSSKVRNVRERVLVDLAAVENATQREHSLIRTFKSNKARQNRLLYLFQCDLLPGLSGKILDLKVHRDDGEAHYNDGIITPWAKALAYICVCGVNACMLFYVFLFALRQTKSRQDAWLRSFLTWLGMDTILVCTLVVVVSNIVIPTYIMRDLSTLKERLLSTLRAYKRRLGQPTSSTTTGTSGTSENNSAFNSADYFFVSNRISRMEEFKKLPVASMISKFTTQLPRQSYQHVQDETLSYQGYFMGLTMGVSSVLVFLIAGFIALPPSFQDSVVYMAFSAACGYIIVLLTQLYSIHPSLVAIPVATSIVLTHFIIRFITAAAAAAAVVMEEDSTTTTTTTTSSSSTTTTTQHLELLQPSPNPALPARIESLQDGLVTTQVL